jgi:hypothetical protein
MPTWFVTYNGCDTEAVAWHGAMPPWALHAEGQMAALGPIEPISIGYIRAVRSRAEGLGVGCHLPPLALDRPEVVIIERRKHIAGNTSAGI